MSYVTLLPEQPVLDDRDDDDVDADDDDVFVQSSSPLRGKLEINHQWVNVAPWCYKWTGWVGSPRWPG